jgi:hypothetical protein
MRFATDIASFAREGVDFEQTPAERFDAIILATGFRPDLRPLLPEARSVLNATGAPLVSGRATAESGLFFCGHSFGTRTIAADRRRGARHCRRGHARGAGRLSAGVIAR